MLKKIDHIGIAVENLDAVYTKFKEVFDLEELKEEFVENQKVRIKSLKIGDSQLEFLEATDSSSTIHKFLEKRGSGIHHISFQVENIDQALILCQKAGIQLIDQTPRSGAGGMKIAFLHPESTFGILIELTEASGEQI